MNQIVLFLVGADVGAHQYVLVGFIMLQTTGTLVQIYCIWVDLGLLTAGVKPSMYALGGLYLSKRTK